MRAALHDASNQCLAELAEIGPAEFAEDHGTDETGSDTLEQCMDETAELALDPGDDYSEEDERSRGASQDLSQRGVVVFNTTSVRSNRRGWFIRGYEGEAEIFLVYCADTDRIYAVPVEDAPAGSGCLRVDPARNGQVDGIRWARDYELPA